MDKKFRLTVSTVIAICIYVLGIILIALYLKKDANEVEKFGTLPTETTIELDLISTNEIQVSKQLPIEEKKIEEIEKLSTAKESTTANLKSLFSNVSDIGTKTINNKEITEDNQKKSQSQYASRFKSHSTETQTPQQIELSKLVDMKNLTSSSRSETTSSNKGEFDEYYSMINTYILRKWYNFPLITDINYLVVANITIDSVGNFSFVMLKYSGDNRVDGALKLFLKNQTLEKYPIPPDKITKTIKVNFKPYSN
ncbi:MAG: hypothetical protein PHF17_08885 [Arcobacteraceae bacterium]|nr:hypothetical protein [Arcobacteraceae bacterium]